MAKRTKHAAYVLALSLLSACTQHADVVGLALKKDAGPGDAGTRKPDAMLDAAGGPLGGCSWDARIARLFWSPGVVHALLIPTSCTIPYKAFARPASDAGTTRDEFLKLVLPNAQQNAGCNEQQVGYVLHEARQEFVLCPATCLGLKRELGRELAQDGCDGPFDAGTFPDFPFPVPNNPKPTKHDAGGASTPPDDASTPDDASH